MSLQKNKVKGAFCGRVLSGDPLLLRADTSGRAVVDSFVASQVAGRYIVTASLAAASAIKDTVNLTVAVPGLELFPESQNYVKVGGTCKHHGPSDKSLAEVPADCRTPDNNHYAAQLVRDSLPLVANKWVDSLGQDALMINDISLPYGGLFDVSGHWRPEHSEHREGLDVDIRTAIPGVRNGVKVRNAQGNWTGNLKFEKPSKDFGVKKSDGHKKGTFQEHYHLDY